MMKTLFLTTAAFAALTLGAPVGTAYAGNMTYESDDGRPVTRAEADRAGAACWLVSSGGFNGVWFTCMRAQGFIIHQH
jgi:hypothetical protein